MRGFTLVELMIAGVLAALVVSAGFMALSGTQLAAATQQRAVDRVSRARLAMELVGNDIRSAGDAVNFLPEWCLSPNHDPSSEWACPAILDAHPWRITLARNAWSEGPDGIPNTTDDVPNTTLAFNANPDNVVTYEFRPVGDKKTVGDRQYYRGRLVRIRDPFNFGGEGSRRETVLLDDVVVDNRMVVDPENPADHDERFDFAVFTYRILSNGPEEFQGDPSIVSRNTKHGVFLLPPAAFYEVGGTLPEQPEGAPYRPTYSNPSFKGSKGKGKGKAVGLRKNSTAAQFENDLKFLLDHNRIRAVRVAFKTVAGDEQEGRTDGIDVDPSRPGTAPTVLLESMFELKVFSSHLAPRSRT
jgi:type II secretory pathway pseudopilin PulG